MRQVGSGPTDVAGSLLRTLAVFLFLGATGCVLGNPRTLPEPATAPAVASVPRKIESAARLQGQWVELGTSVAGRSVRARTFGKGARRVLWIGGIHGNEPEGRTATDELPEAFGARGLATTVTLTILEDLNPDGSARRTRQNANGVDLNRNFPARNFDQKRAAFGEQPLSQPESRVLHDLILAFDPHLVIVAHSWRGRHFINFDGPAEGLAKHFARVSGYPLVRSTEFAATPGSLGSWVGRDLAKPILTLEYLNGKNPRAAWSETREAILDAIAGVED